MGALPKENTTRQAPRGIGGFLLLFIVFLVLQALNTFFAGVSYLSEVDTYSIGSGIVLVGYSVYAALVIALIVWKHSQARKHTRILLYSVILLTVGFAGADYLLFEARPTPRQGSIVLLAIVWLFYWDHSRRVAATIGDSQGEK